MVANNRGIELRRLDALGAMRGMERNADTIIECEEPELEEWRERTTQQAELIAQRLGNRVLVASGREIPDNSPFWELEDEHGKMQAIYDANTEFLLWQDNEIIRRVP